MHAVLALTPLHDALAELELAVALVLLAEQEGQAIGDTLPRLRRALAGVGEVRDLASGLGGRPEGGFQLSSAMRYEHHPHGLRCGRAHRLARRPRAHLVVVGSQSLWIVAAAVFLLPRGTKRQRW